MSDSEQEDKPAGLASEVKHMRIDIDRSREKADADFPLKAEKQRTATPNGTSTLRKIKSTSASQSPAKTQSTASSPDTKSDMEEKEIVGGEISLKEEPGKAPKLSRSASQKIVARPPPTFLDWADKTEEAKTTFDVLPECLYLSKHLGTTEHALECDCAEEWDATTKSNHACGEDSDCINRATKMECVGDCTCGDGCQNQRFQNKQYADVTVIKTEKKGYGLRANKDLRTGTFIFEYIGEVIHEGAFRRRMHQYDEEGIKHFYFMSLTKGEFVDATKKGNLGRFCNHSCNPNCFVDKWVVGEKLRMGIFAERHIKAGEELTFNYNVDRYGADPQPCYCGESNCTGFIGGKTQTERATKLSHATIEALGIDDGDGWDLAVAKKPRKKKVSEDDEEYVNDVQPKSLDEGGVTKVMATLMQCKEKWIAVKLLSRIHRADDERVRARVVRMHGYQILKSALSTWSDDANVVLQVLDILNSLPRITRNKIQDSKIEETVEKLTTSDDERVQTKAKDLLQEWNKLEVAYRIPRMKRDPAATTPVVATTRYERREPTRERSRSSSRSRSKSLDAPRGPTAPAGSRPNMSQRGGHHFNGPRPPFRRPPINPLPAGWFAANANGQTYYYSASGQTTWQRPTAPASQPPPPPRAMTNEQKLQEIINNITKETPKEKASASATPQPTSHAGSSSTPKKQEKWRSYSEEKQMKLYENAIHPHVMYVMGKFKSKLPKEDLKRYTKEASKHIVKSDFKHKRVHDPNKIDAKKETQVKKYIKEFLDKAVTKRRAHEKKKAEKEAKSAAGTAGSPVNTSQPNGTPTVEDEVSAEMDQSMLDGSDEEGDSFAKTQLSPDHSTPKARESSEDLKRKRDGSSSDTEDDEESSAKKFKGDAPPPPPPPPPADGGAEFVDIDAVDAATLTPAEDSFHTEAWEAVRMNGAYKAELPSSRLHSRYEARPEDINGHTSPMQLATPSTNGSYDDSRGDSRDNEVRKMNGGRRRPLGIGTS